MFSNWNEATQRQNTAFQTFLPLQWALTGNFITAQSEGKNSKPLLRADIALHIPTA